VDPSHEEESLRVLIHLLGRNAYREGFASLSLQLLAPRRFHDILDDAGLVARERMPVYAAFAPNHAGLSTAPLYMTRADLDV
jgi:hypothetical protein